MNRMSQFFRLILVISAFCALTATAWAHNINISSPQAGQTYYYGSHCSPRQIPVQWSYPIVNDRTRSEYVHYWKVSLSIDGGNNWIPKHTLSRGARSSNISTSQYELSNNCRVKIVGYRANGGINKHATSGVFFTVRCPNQMKGDDPETPNTLDGTENSDNAPQLSDGVPPLTPSLTQNYPNPFNPTTQIAFNLPEAAPVKLEVFNTLGQTVVTLVNGVQAAGSHVVNFNASALPSGVYLYKLTAGQHCEMKKMMLTK